MSGFIINPFAFEATGGGEGPAGVSTDFSEYTTGSAPSDWTTHYQTLWNTYTVEDNAGSNELQAVSTQDQNNHDRIDWDVLNASGDVEVLALVRDADLSGGNYSVGVAVRTDVADDALNGYAVLFRTNYAALQRFTGDAGSLGQYQAVVYAAGDAVWVRLRAVGSTIQARTWKDGESEPATWPMEFTDSTYASGGAGFVTRTEVSTYACEFFSYALNGDMAPGPA